MLVVGRQAVDGNELMRERINEACLCVPLNTRPFSLPHPLDNLPTNRECSRQGSGRGQGKLAYFDEGGAAECQAETERARLRTTQVHLLWYMAQFGELRKWNVVYGKPFRCSIILPFEKKRFCVSVSRRRIIQSDANACVPGGCRLVSW